MRMDQTCLVHRPVFMQKAHRFILITSSMIHQRMLWACLMLLFARHWYGARRSMAIVI